MRRLLCLALLAASLLPSCGPARAQATADQLNRLSLEALTAQPPGGGGGGGGNSRRSYRPTYHRSARSYARVSERRGRSYTRRYASVRHYTTGRHYAARHYGAAIRYASARHRVVAARYAHVTRVSYTRHHTAPASRRWRHR